jgi:hypothetical protein
MKPDPITYTNDTLYDQWAREAAVSQAKSDALKAAVKLCTLDPLRVGWGFASGCAEEDLAAALTRAGLMEKR